ncbi:MAG: hypothetical protein OER90_09580 [Gemmatimonadota bacterium]|nr:hypothetical protein [Gemmatimonadota bacterium]
MPGQRFVLSLAVLFAFAYAAAPGGVTRTYYVAADDVPWDYVPGGTNGTPASPTRTPRSSNTDRPVL